MFWTSHRSDGKIVSKMSCIMLSGTLNPGLLAAVLYLYLEIFVTVLSFCMCFALCL